MGNASRKAPGDEPGTVHPHSRGERPGVLQTDRGVGGSSPLAWGTRQVEGLVVVRLRFIPTRVGNAPTNSSMQGTASGSSPLAWGTRPWAQVVVALVRFIPTRVGNANSTPSPSPSLSGSSPLAWGTPIRFVLQLVPNSVHPHSRGERRCGLGVDLQFDGSSPLAWGTRLSEPQGASLVRFIPTRVGNAARINESTAPKPVHPHSRGERWIQTTARPCLSGSSPLAWGTQP